MFTVVIVVHLLVAIALVGAILLQRSEGGGLGMGGGGGGGGGFMTSRSTANLLTRATTGLAAVFFVTSMTLAILSGGQRQTKSIMDEPAVDIQAPVSSGEPSAPLAK